MDRTEAEADRGKTVGYFINRAARLMHRASEPRLREIELAVAQLPVLVALKDGRALPQKELAAIAQVEQSTAAQLLSRMERDGLIQYAPDPADRRSRLVSLTPKALTLLPEGRAILLDVNRQALAGFDESEIATLRGFLRRVIVNLEQDGPDASEEAQ